MKESVLYHLFMRLYSGYAGSMLHRILCSLLAQARASRLAVGSDRALDGLFRGDSYFLHIFYRAAQRLLGWIAPISDWLHRHVRGSWTGKVVFGTVNRSRLIWLLAGVFMLVPLLPTRGTLWLLAAVLAYGIGFAVFSRGKHTLLETPLDRTMLLIFVIFTISALTSVNVMLSLPSYITFIAAFLLAYMIAYSAGHFRELETIVIGVAVGVFLVSLYGMYQYVFMDIHDKAWIDESLNQNIDKRVYSFLGNPNVLACFMVMTLPMISGLIVHGRNRWIQWFAAGTVLLALLVTLLTFSRGGWLGLGVAVLFMVRLYPRILLALPFMMAGPFLLFFDQIMTRIASLTTSDSSISYRMYIWNSVGEMIRDYGWSGMGLGTHLFHQMFYMYHGSIAVVAFHAHNFLLQMIVELGYFGVAGMALFFLQMVYLTLKLPRAQAAGTLAGYIMTGCCAGFIGVLAYGIADHVWGSTILYYLFWMMAGLFMAASRIAKQ